MAKPAITFSNWAGENQLTWAKETPNFLNLVIAGAILDVSEFEGTDYELEDGRIEVPSGTLIGRTYAEAAAGTGYGPVDFTADTSVDDDEVYLVYNGVYDARENDETNIYRHQRVVAVNKLPGWADLDPVLQAFVRANYQTMNAAE